jgi:hypothetical protein
MAINISTDNRLHPYSPRCHSEYRLLIQRLERESFPVNLESYARYKLFSISGCRPFRNLPPLLILLSVHCRRVSRPFAPATTNPGRHPSKSTPHPFKPLPLYFQSQLLSGTLRSEPPVFRSLPVRAYYKSSRTRLHIPCIRQQQQCPRQYARATSALSCSTLR